MMTSPWFCQARYWFGLVQSLSRRTKVVDSTTFPTSKLRTDSLFIWNIMGELPSTVNFTDATHTSFNCTFISRTTFGGGRGGQGSESHSSVSINTHKTNSRRGYSYNVRSHNFYNFQIEILLVKICTLSSSLTAPAAWRILGVWIQTALRSGGYTELARADGDNRQEVILHLGILDLTFHETLLEVSGWLLSAQ